MAQKTLYVRPADEPTWTELEALATRRGVAVSMLVAEAIRRLLATDGSMTDVD